METSYGIMTDVTFERLELALAERKYVTDSKVKTGSFDSENFNVIVSGAREPQGLNTPLHSGEGEESDVEWYRESLREDPSFIEDPSFSVVLDPSIQPNSMDRLDLLAEMREEILGIKRDLIRGGRRAHAYELVEETLTGKESYEMRTLE